MSSDELHFSQLQSHLVKRLATYLRPYLGGFVIALSCLILAQAMQLLQPELIGRSIDIAVDPSLSFDEKMEKVQPLVMIFCLSVLLLLTSNYFGQVQSAKVGHRSILDLRRQVFNHVLSKPVVFFQSQPLGRLVTRVSFDLESLVQMYNTGVVTFLIDLLLMSGVVVIMWTKTQSVGWLLLMSLPLMILITRVFLRNARPANLTERAALASINAFLSENINGIRVIQAFAAERKMVRMMRALVFKHLRSLLKTLRISVAYTCSTAGMTYLVQLVILVHTASLCQRGVLNLGDFISTNFFMEMFFRPVRNMGEKINVLQIAMASSERLFDLLDNQEALDDADEEQTSAMKGEVSFKEVVFAYDPHKPLIQNMSFHVPAGQRVALVGSTGAGKSTILKLINRFYDVHSGQVLVDGCDVKTWQRQNLRRQIGVVQQDVFLFSGSVRRNITLDDPRVSDADVLRAARAVGVVDFIESLPQGFETDLKERGASLSLGQRQLISFARILAADPNILILDEATAHIDSVSERIIQEALKNLMKDRTCFVVAHRLSTIRACDRIMVIEEGNIIEDGSHEELIKLGGRYAQLYRDQSEAALRTRDD